VRLARHEVTIDAVASAVYRHLTQVESLLKWMAVDAVADPVPGGELKWTHANGMIGRFVEPIPSRRIVFTYGWEDGRMGLPPESTLVEIDLEEREGKTILRLVHRNLPPEAVDDHQYGWVFFLNQLRDNLTLRK